MNNNQFFIRGIGNISVRQSKRARYLSISIKPFKGVVVTVPFGASYKSAARLVDEKKDWILKNLEKVREIENGKSIFDESTELALRDHKVVINQSDEEYVKVKVANKLINVSYPKTDDVKSDYVQSAIEQGIIWAMRKLAHEYLPGRVGQLAKQFGFKYEQLRLKNIKSRWGSCSKRNNINLSIHLIKLPDYLIDYVILHELAHTVHKNHGPKFWKLLQQSTGNARGLDKELRDYRIREY